MAKKVKIELNRDAINAQLLKSAAIENFLEKEAKKIQSRCGDSEGYQTDTYMAGTRVIASVYTATPKAMRSNLKNNTLLKALGGSK